MKSLIRIFLLCFILSGSISQAKDLKSIYELTVKLIRQKEFENALRYLKYLQKKQPGEDRWWFMTARVHYMNRDLMDAMRSCSRVKKEEYLKKCSVLFDKAQEKAPKAYQYFQALQAVENNLPDKAREELKPLLEEDIYSPRYRLLMGRIFESEGKLHNAMDEYLYVLDSVSRRHRDKVQAFLDRLAAHGDKVVEFLEGNPLPEEAGEDRDEYFQLYYLALRLHPRTYDPGAKKLGRELDKYLIERIQNNPGGKEFELTYARAVLLALMGDKGASRAVFKTARQKAANPLQEEHTKFLLEKLSEPF